MRDEGREMISKIWRKTFFFCHPSSIISLLSFLICLLNLSGCGPTYPKEKIEESIIKICKNEYKLDVKVERAGKTVAIYVPLTDFLDLNFSITEPAIEKINDVTTSASRVTLSTDADIDFFCIIAHDVRIPEMQMIVVRYINDVKRGFLGDISRGESFKRMVIDFRLNPQAQKERAIKEVFEKMTLDKKWQEDVMNDFFRSEPGGLGDIGYWNNRFYIKDISLSEFLAAEIANRIRIEFKQDKDLTDTYQVKSAKAFYNDKFAKPYFRVEISVEPKWLKDIDSGKIADKVFLKTLTVAAYVVHSYSFDKFDYMEIVNETDGKTLRISRDDLEAFRKKQLSFEDALTKGRQIETSIQTSIAR